MVSTFYLVLFIVSFIYLVVFMIEFSQHVSVFYPLLCLAILVMNFGYWQISIADTVEAAIVSNKVVYIGASFIHLLMVACLAEICKTEVPQFMKVLGCFAGMVIFALNLTVGNSDLYYKNCSIEVVNGCTYLVRDYGPTHFLFPVLVICAMLYGDYIVIRALLEKRKVSFISSYYSLGIMVICNGIYFAEKLLKLKFELLPLAYVLGLSGIFVLLSRIKMYDITGIYADSLEGGTEFGFIIFDSRLRFSAADENARRWFPELNELVVDGIIRKFDTKMLEQIRTWATGGSEGNIYFRCGDRIVAASHFSVGRNNRRIHGVRLHDETQEQEYKQLIENYNSHLMEEVQQKTQKLNLVQEDIIMSMAAIVENRDASTGGHIRRTRDVIKIFVNHLEQKGSFGELTHQTADCIVRAAPLHDFGKIGIPDVILNKPGKYTEEEYDEMKKHPAIGSVIVARILKSSEDIQFKNIAVNIAHYHHEKWDGTGYPDHLRENEIPFEARVMALADVFDALVSKRVYKEQYSYDRAFSIIRESRGTHFDPALCDSFLECREQLEQLYSSYPD